MKCCRGHIGDLLSIEGRAIKREYQGRGLGKTALQQILATEQFDAAASVTRNPAVLKVMQSGFCTVSPDLRAADPLHYMRDPLLRELASVYSAHIGSDPKDAPFVPGRYTGGLYGGEDPGRGMAALPQLAANPENGVMMLAADKVAAQ
ncbi:MAG TPA: hypothetical protein VLF62_00685 [Candidatus Saccharimonadales bacterium]|nr:hypothetical protein [Candidatus Saccharimonadales bacterium]